MHSNPLPAALFLRILIPAAIALALISFFLLSAGPANPEWDEFWYFRPLFVYPVVAGMAGFINYYLSTLPADGLKKWLLRGIGAVVYFLAFWIGAVIALAGYYWH